MGQVTHYGPHRLTRLSISDPALSSLFDPSEYAQTLYVDPPWGDPHMKFFATQRRKQTAVNEPPLLFADLLSRLGDLTAAHVRGMVYVEMGERWTEQTAEAIEAAGITLIATHTIYYKGNKGLLPAKLIEGHIGIDSPYPIEFDPGQYQGVALPRSILASAPQNSIVFDPCCGMGFTAQAATSHSLRFYGNEFNSARADKTAAILQP
jgi:hypothetical protein